MGICRTKSIKAQVITINGILNNILVNLYEVYRLKIILCYKIKNKEPGKGTGLGLSICYQIVVEKHKSQIKCSSLLGEGTEFIIIIPVIGSNNSIS